MTTDIHHLRAPRPLAHLDMALSALHQAAVEDGKRRIAELMRKGSALPATEAPR